MSDERLTEQPAPSAQGPAGFRPPTPRQRTWTTREWTAVLIAVALAAVFGFYCGASLVPGTGPPSLLAAGAGAIVACCFVVVVVAAVARPGRLKRREPA